MKASVVICLLMAFSLDRLVSSTRVVRQSSTECTYISTKLKAGSSQIDPSQVPSLSPVCVQAANNLLAAGVAATPAVLQGICITQCQTLYNLIAGCYGNSSADFQLNLYCGTINGTDCQTVRYGSTYKQLNSTVAANCGPPNATSCTSNCTTALQNAVNYAGCCSLNNQASYNACNITLPGQCAMFNGMYSGAEATNRFFCNCLSIVMLLILLAMY